MKHGKTTSSKDYQLTNKTLTCYRCGTPSPLRKVRRMSPKGDISPDYICHDCFKIYNQIVEGSNARQTD